MFNWGHYNSASTLKNVLFFNLQCHLGALFRNYGSLCNLQVYPQFIGWSVLSLHPQGRMLASAHYSLTLYLVRAASCFSGDCHTAMLAISCGWNSAPTDIIGSKGRVTEYRQQPKKKEKRFVIQTFYPFSFHVSHWACHVLTGWMLKRKYAKTQSEMGILAYRQIRISISKSVELLVCNVHTN